MGQNPLPHISQSYITLIVKIAATTVVKVALFSRDLTIVFNDALQSETTSHILHYYIYSHIYLPQEKNARSSSLIRNAMINYTHFLQ